jgi:hypothetical protein
VCQLNFGYFSHNIFYSCLTGVQVSVSTCVVPRYVHRICIYQTAAKFVKIIIIVMKHYLLQVLYSLQKPNHTSSSIFSSYDCSVLTINNETKVRLLFMFDYLYFSVHEHALWFIMCFSARTIVNYWLYTLIQFRMEL